MKNILYYIPVFIIPMIIMIVGSINNNQKTINSGLSLLFYLLPVLLGIVIGAVSKKKINLKELKLPITLFILSIIAIICSFYLDKIIIGCIISFVLGTFSFIYIYKKGV